MDDDGEVAWLKGLAAGMAMRPRTANPFEAGGASFLDWDGGWREGRHVAEQPRAGRRERAAHA